MMTDYFKISKFFLYLAPLSVVIVSTSTLFPFIVGKYAFFRTTVGLALIFYLIGLLFDKQRLSFVNGQLSNVFKRPLIIAVSLFVFIFLLAGVFGVDPAMSFWSNFERGEGGLQVLHLSFFLFLLSSLLPTADDWRRMLRWVVAGGVLMVVYGLFAAYGYQGFVGATFAEQGFRFQGSIGNPAYVGAVCIFFL